MSVLHDFECEAHGRFEARVQGGVTPRCPHGCSPGFVRLVHLTPPAIGSERVRTAGRLVREMADLQGLSDIDVSPSTPGGSVAEKNFLRSGNPVRPEAVPAGKFLSAMTHRANELAKAGFGHAYNPHEWMTDPKTGVRRHTPAAPNEPLPMNQFGVSIARVKEKP